jgi:hypothetical protein
MATTELQQILKELRKVDGHPELMPSLVKKMEEVNAFYLIRIEFNKITKKESSLPLSDREHVIFIYRLLKKGFEECKKL